MQPFENVKVLDLTHVYTGPFCTYQLAVLGAEVLKIEPPDRPDMTRHQIGMAEPAPGMNLSYLTQGANKRALTLDLKSPQGRKILKRLVATSDVLVENHRAGVLENLGLGYKELSAVNPRLIYCSITGFGQTGPKRGHGAFDPVIQAISGLMSVTGTPETAPVKVGSPVVDYGTGIFAAYAVAAALFQREKTGRGQCIDVAMTDAALMLMSSTMVAYLNSGDEGGPVGNLNHYGNASYTTHRTKDGLLMLAAYLPHQRKHLWEALGRPHEAETAARTDMEGIPALFKQEHELLGAILATKTTAEWLPLLHAKGVPAEPVLTVGQAAGHAQLKHRNVFHTIEDAAGPGIDVTVPVSAFTYAEGGPAVRSAPPRHGQHSDEVLKELGFSDPEIASLRARKVV